MAEGGEKGDAPVDSDVALNGGRDPYSALRFRSFRFFILNSLMAVIGAQISAVAFGWELYDRTGSKLALGLYGLAQALPRFVFTLPAGHAADTFDRKRMTVVVQLSAVLCGLAMAFLSYTHGSILLMYAVIVLRSIGWVFGGASRTSVLPQIVPAHSLSNAITWNSSLFQLATAIGPVLSGLIMAVSLPAAYLADAGCLAIAVLSMAAVEVPKARTPKTSARIGDVGAGLRFVFNNKIILSALTLDMLAVLFGGADFLLPVYAADILKVGKEGLGWLRAAPAAGAVFMAVLLAHLPPLKNSGRALLLSVAGFGVATIAFGLSEVFWFSLLMLFVSGALDFISVVIRHTLVQLLAPENMRGRISAVNNMFIGASNDLGGFESGLTAWLFGPVASVVGGGIGTILVVCGVALVWPQLRRVGALDDQKPVEDD